MEFTITRVIGRSETNNMRVAQVRFDPRENFGCFAPRIRKGQAAGFARETLEYRVQRFDGVGERISVAFNATNP